jgi:hypothetical protein
VGWCVRADPSVPVHSPRFWDDALWLRTGGDGAALIPGFLQPVAAAVLAASKSTLLLRAHGAEDAGVALPEHGHSLQEDIMSRLQRMVWDSLLVLLQSAARTNQCRDCSEVSGCLAACDQVLPAALEEGNAASMPTAAGEGIADRMAAAGSAGPFHTGLCMPDGTDAVSIAPQSTAALEIGGEQQQHEEQLAQIAADQDAGSLQEACSTQPSPAMAAAELQAWYDRCVGYHLG